MNGDEAFGLFFKTATGGVSPYIWQSSLAERQCCSALIDVPTGCGKTAGAVLGWLWNRVILQKCDWPRRLVYCLPMRVLVEQTVAEIQKWLTNIWSNRYKLQLSSETCQDLLWLTGDNTGANPRHSPVVLMGGEELDKARRDWDLWPEKPAIIVGTQDMLLSRALNRGYAMRRYRWPLQFGLLNNDSLWVLDEIQLMEAGLATSCQLEAFRMAPGTDGPQGVGSFFGNRSLTWYMSATTNHDVLKTRDWRNQVRPAGFEFGLSDREKSETKTAIGRRRCAVKRLALREGSHFGREAVPEEVAKEIAYYHTKMVTELQKHDAPPEIPRRSLIVCNTVARAVALFDALSCETAEDVQLSGVDPILLHSRFRPKEREEPFSQLKETSPDKFPRGQIVVATQVVEAGVDLSSGILWTEIAPLSSLVQRFGRLNRNGEFGSNGSIDFGWTPTAITVGLELPDIPAKPKDARERAQKEAHRRFLPYEQDACASAWQSLAKLNGNASPAALENIRPDISSSIKPLPYSLQRHELLDFFDTDSNLSLGYTDVSPFVRGLDEDTDVYVLWREWEGFEVGQPPPFTYDVQRNELCAVSIGRFRASAQVWRSGWLWLGGEKNWVPATTQGVLPGATVLLPLMAGGYSMKRGWTGNPEDNLLPAAYEPSGEPSDEDVLSVLPQGWRSIADHTQDVQEELEAILNALSCSGITAEQRAASLDAALWHDIGKNHSKWQDAVRQAVDGAGVKAPSGVEPYAKFSLAGSPLLRDAGGNPQELKRAVYRLKRSFRPGIAHEVASALALRQHHIETAGEQRLAYSSDRNACLAQLLSEYLVMSHHGRVRKVLRDEIPKKPSLRKDVATVRGVTEGERLDPITIGAHRIGGNTLSVDCRRIGRDASGYESYTRGVLRLLDHDQYGPFRLAYLEALLRAADGRASARASTAKSGPIPAAARAET